MFQFNLWSLPIFFSLLIALSMLWRWRQYAHVPGVEASLWTLVGIVIWSSMYLLELTLTVDAYKLIAAKMMNFGIMIVPVGWSLFSVMYARRQRHVRLSSIILLGAIPAIAFLAACSNELHYLFWSSQVHDPNSLRAVIVTFGPIYYLNMLYSYALVFVSTSVLMFYLGQSRRHRKSLWMVALAIFCFFLFDILSVLAVNDIIPAPSQMIDLTAFSFAIAALLVNWAIYDYGLLDHPPVMRNLIIERSVDPMVIINYEKVIIDMNPSAAKLFQIGSKGLITSDRPLPSSLQTPAFSKLLRGECDKVEQQIGACFFDIRASFLEEIHTEKSEISLIFRDITERKLAELELVGLKEKFEKLAYTDTLTDLHNRRLFIQRLHEEAERAVRYSTALSLMIFDLDYFKSVNDTYGHDMGDQVLKSVAMTTMGVVRGSDFAARIGGEEFAVLLPQTEMSGALEIAERLREKIAMNPVIINESALLNITVSVGVASLDLQGNDIPEVLLNLADKALYRAKGNGRNRVSI
ncbi:MAG: diguanylate cyclase [Pseudomonadota bacterium]